MDKSVLLRYIGNVLLVIGYFVLLWENFKYGLLLKCIGGILTVPFAYKLKMYDVLALSGFFTFIEVSKLIHLFFH